MAPSHASQTVGDLGPGDHVCYLYSTEKAHQALLTPFLRHGLERGERMLYIADSHPIDVVMTYLEQDGVAAEPYLTSGQLSLLTSDETYLRDGKFDPDGMIDYLHTATEQALADGYVALRVTSEMTWVLRGLPGSERLTEYVHKLNSFFPGSKCLAIFQYDRRSFDPALLLDALRSHPGVVVETELYDNFYYMPPEDCRPESAEVLLQHWLDNLASQKQVERSLRERAEQFHLLVDAVQNYAIFTLNLDGHVVTWNSGAERIKGYSAEEIIGEHYSCFFCPEDIAHDKPTHELEVAARDGRLESEGWRIRKDGTRFWAHVVISALRDQDRRLIGFSKVTHDITDRRAAEQERLKRERQLADAQQIAQLGGWEWDIPANVLTWSKELYRIYGLDPQAVSLSYDVFLAHLHPDDRASVEAVIERALGDHQPFSLEHRIVRPDGTVRTLHGRGQVVLDEHGRPVRMLGTGQDISERKRMELSLRESNMLLGNLFESSPDSTVLVDTEGRIVRANQQVEVLFGYDREALLGKHIETLLPGQFSELLVRLGSNDERRSSRSPSGTGLVPHAKRHDGSEFPVEVVYTALEMERGDLVACVIRDISKQKQAEEALRRSEAYFRSVTQNALDIVTIVDGEGIIRYASPSVKRVLGYTPEELVGRQAWELINPDDQPTLMDVANEGPDAVDLHTPRVFRCRHKDGSWRTLESSATNLLDDPKVAGIVVSSRDITERRQMEQALRKSEERYRTLAESSMVGIWHINVDGYTVYLNPAMCAMLEISGPEELIGCTFYTFLTPESAATVQRQREDSERNGPASYEVEVMGQHGRRRNAIMSEAPLLRADGTPHSFIATFADVSDYKKAQQALQESEARFRAVFEGAAFGIALIDFEGKLIASNPALQVISGYNEEALRGMRLADVVHPQDQRWFVDSFEALISGARERVDIEMRSYRNDGQMMWVHGILSLVHDAEQEPRFVVAMVEDVTENRRVGQELAEIRRGLADSLEAERLHLAQELHDGPIQELHAIGFQLEMLASRFGDGDGAEEWSEAQTAVQQTVRALRTICNDLRPPTLAAFGLELAIRSYVENFQASHPELNLTTDLMHDGQELPERVRMALYRIMQQALINTARHAEAQHVVVRFRLDEQQVLLEIEDDGRGFEVPQRWGQLVRRGHLGLAGAAERAEVIGARLKVRSSPGEGTLVRVAVPREAQRAEEK